MSKRAVFEEVSGTKTQTAAAPARGPVRDARAAIAAWLWCLAGLVAVMVLIGGLTRLTDSGLSITVWAPVMGAIPPLSDTAWQEAFAAYQTTTEFREQNSWMTLEDFKPIYWWEWGHRALGRVIGIVWAVGLGVFLARRMVPKGWTWRLVLPGLLGAAQGAIGWWMVTSGLQGRLDVASYRLAIHLGLAFVIFMLLVWLALRIRLDPTEALKARRRRMGGMGWTATLGGVVFAQILGGALVAGIDAGRGYVDWPLMQGAFLPPESFELSPLWRNFFENAALVQFVHRMLGYAVLVLGVVAVIRLARAGNRALARTALLLGFVTLAQVVVGIVTVMNAAPLEIAIWHQAGALVLTGVLVLTHFRAAYPTEQRIARG